MKLSLVLCALGPAVFVACTPTQKAEVRTALSVNEAACAVVHAIKGKTPTAVATFCNIELPLAEAIVNVVAAQGDVP